MDESVGGQWVGFWFAVVISCVSLGGWVSGMGWSYWLICVGGRWGRVSGEWRVALTRASGEWRLRARVASGGGAGGAASGVYLGVFIAISRSCSTFVISDQVLGVPKNISCMAR